MKEINDYKKEVSALAKDLNRVRKQCTNQVAACKNRKEQLTMWNLFFVKLLNEGRITKAELSKYSPRKPKP